MDSNVENSPGSEIPSDIQNIRNAYSIAKNTLSDAKGKLFHHKRGHEADTKAGLEDIYKQRWDSIDKSKFPTFIQLQEGEHYRAANLPIDLGERGLHVRNDTSILPRAISPNTKIGDIGGIVWPGKEYRYYFFAAGKTYTIKPPSQFHVQANISTSLDPKFFPSSPDFIGFETIEEMIRIRQDGSKKQRDNMAERIGVDKLPNNITIENQIFPHDKLDLLIDALPEGSAEKLEIEELKRDLDYEKEQGIKESNIKRGDVSAQEVTRVKRRIEILRDEIASKYGYKSILRRKGLPKTMDVTFSTIPFVQKRVDLNVNEHLYYLSEENRLVRGTPTQLTWNKNPEDEKKLREVLKNARDASDTDWVEYGENIIQDLLAPLIGTENYRYVTTGFK